MHCNFSTAKMREGGKEYFDKLMAAFEKNCMGTSLSTGPITTSGSPASTRPSPSTSFLGALQTVSFHPGPSLLRQERLERLPEDRRPNSQGDPYAIASRVLATIAEAE